MHSAFVANPPMKLLILFLLALSSALADPAAVKDLPYKTGGTLTDYEKERCKLDLYLPSNRSGFPTLVWFHGGAMTAGVKDDDFTADIGAFFARSGIACAAVNYRLSPKATYPAYVEDAAAAFAWVRAHIAEHGGDAEKVFVGGHSAGGYLTAMIGMDPRYLRSLGCEPETIAGLIPVSAQVTTHFTVRAERGIDRNTVISDEAAPIYYTRKETPPMLVLYCDNDWPAREQENAYFVAALKAAGNVKITGRLITGRDHGSIARRIPEPGDVVGAAIVEFIEKIAKERGPKP